MKAFAMRFAAIFLLAGFLCALCGCTAASVTETVLSIEESAQPAPETPPALLPTPTPTPAPTAAPTPQPAVDSGYYDAFFDDAVFLGDSITQGLQLHVVRMRKEQPNLLGTARFAAAKSFGLKKASSLRKSDAALPFRGKNLLVPDLVTAMEARKVFLMLGVNDWAGSHITECVEQYRATIENIRAAAPDVEIYVQSCTPVVKGKERGKLNNENLDAFNLELQALCAELSVPYVDIASALKGEDNGLIPEYSSDNYVHVSAEGAAAWVGALYQYAFDRCAAGAWDGPVSSDGLLLQTVEPPTGE